MRVEASRITSFIESRFRRWDIDPTSYQLGPALVRELVSCIGPSYPETAWKRHPSIALDGTPAIFSWKCGQAERDSLRLLIEPGSLAMSVAQQIAFTLDSLDKLLGQFHWSGAIQDINAITARVFPPDASMTAEWWGGMWLGASVDLQSGNSAGGGDPELRLYLNLRFGDAATRWERLHTLLASFDSSGSPSLFDHWANNARPLAIPVGLGVAVSSGRVRVIRPYLGVHLPAPPSLSSLNLPEATKLPPELEVALRGFTTLFGPLRPQTVTVGYDFLKSLAGGLSLAPSRVKFDLCCHHLPADLRPEVYGWINSLMQDFSLETTPFFLFINDLNKVWAASEIQFVSLGFTPNFNHLTVYAKPGCLRQNQTRGHSGHGLS